MVAPLPGDDTAPAGRRARRVAAVATAVAAFVLLAWGLVVEPNRVVPVAVAIPCQGLERESIRILLVSDVDFSIVDRRAAAIRAAARTFDPDVILVAGDYLNRIEAPPDRARLARAGDFLASLPSRYGRFLVPGEDESHAVDLLRDAWRGVVDVLSNERRFLDIRGETVDLFGAHARVDRVPWPLGVEDGREFVFSHGRPHVWQQRVVYVGEGAGSFGDVEIALSFQGLDERSYLDVRFGWVEGVEPEGGNGWRLTRHEGRRDFKLTAGPGGRARLKGAVISGFVPPTGVWCRARIRMDDEGERVRVRARFWRETDPEPGAWPIDAFDDGPDRSRAGTIALGGRRGSRRYAELVVRDRNGRVLLDEDFRDRRRFERDWSSGSVLSSWLGAEGDASAARLLLAHEPDVVIDVADHGGVEPPLVLAGHTHGGQIRLPGIGALHAATRIGRRYDRGLFDFGGVPLYITAGIGTSIVPIRLFNPPEVTLLTLTPRRYPGVRGED